MSFINQSIRCSKHYSVVIVILLCFQVNIFAQKPTLPIPMELLVGDKKLYSQMVLKKPFSSQSKFDIFGLATYSADYRNDMNENRITIITQISYNFKQGFGVMAGTDINSFSGFSPIIGPQHNFANQKWLAITIASFFINESNDFKIFGLYEYKPKINEQWGIYSRLQFIYNHSLKEGRHNVSYIYLRAGLKRESFIFGLGANIDWSGPNKKSFENLGGFLRWEFK